MRYLGFLITFLLLASCTLVEPFDNRDHAYIAVEFPRENGRLFIAKIGVIRDRDDSPVRFEGTVRSANSTFIRVNRNASSPFSLAERADGEEVYVFLGRGIGQVSAARVEVFEVDALRQRLAVDEDDALRDGVLVCDLEQVFNTEITNYLAREGLRPDLPFQVSFAPLPRDFRASRSFEPLGWSDSTAFVVQLDIEVTARIRRDGAAIGGVILRSSPRYLIYDTGTGVPVCETERPVIMANRSPLFPSQVVRAGGLPQLFLIDGEPLYRFPAANADRTNLYTDSGRFLAIIGPFPGP